MTRAARFNVFAVVLPLALAGVVAVPLSARAGSDGVVPDHDQPRQKGYRPGADIAEQIGAQVPLDLTFRDENDRPIALGEAMAGKPTILVPVYYRCPMLCTEILNGLLVALRAMPQDFTAGDQFTVVTVSMDPKEHGDLARAKKHAYLNGDPQAQQPGYGRPGAENGWRFLTGTKESIAGLLDTVGYKFEFDKMLKEYNHPSALIILSPQGKVTRYFYGLKYDGEFALDLPGPTDAKGKMTRPTTTLRMSLIEAAEGKGGSLFDKLLFLCYRYDRLHQGYSLKVLWLVRIGGLITLLAVAGGALWAVSKEGILRVVLGRVAVFALVCVAVSGLGLGGSLLGTDATLAAVLLSISFVAVLAVLVIAFRRGRSAHAAAPAPGENGAGHNDVLPTGGTA